MEAKPSAVIVADGGVDLPEWAASEMNIRVVPLMVRFGDEELRSGIDITPAQFYERLRNGEIPATSQPSVGDFLAIYKEAAEAGLPILSFHLSAGLSGSIRSAQTARDMLPDLDIRLVDTGTLSGAMAMQVLVAADAVARGADPDEAIAMAREVGAKTDMFFTIDKLDYLRRGGRIGKVAGYVGSFLGIRPIVTVEKPAGTYAAVGRARSYRGAVSNIVDMIVERLGEGAEVSCVAINADSGAEVEWLIKSLNERMRPVWVEVVRGNPSLGAHVGPDALAIAVYPGLLPIKSLALR